MATTHAAQATAERAHELVAAHLARFPGREFTSHDLARVLGLSNTTARTALQRLADAGHVEITRAPDPALGKRLSTRYRATTTTTGARS
ncbi:helix-turn-helix domain-containing protein [Microbispora sp. GKU 823]|uniref:MarR family transcriptional regulator n=1 Tax=Microbispora sp. GKU 823 TaxID=1652100 RepID=UPI0009A432A3|nr:helix-turn-helix domain-containing protein [Microbispora sp. GKU 823]OPG13672.1 hypothetical protein B1L11_06710 [Microbispora sp. GKU 823]